MPESPDIVLHQFAFSHYNEKVRWALDWKGLASTRNSLLPGFHSRTTGRVAQGATQTPTLSYDGEGITGSSDIVRFLDERHPELPLYPTAPEQRAEVEQWVTWLDDEVGPAVRLALFHELFEDLDYAGKVFTTDRSGWKAGVYRKMMPRLVPMLRQRMSIDDATAADARETVGHALERLDKASQATGYLVGDTFTVADLTAACLCMPLYFPDEVKFEMPKQPSAVLDGWLARWRGAPGEPYVRSMWARHR